MWYHLEGADGLTGISGPFKDRRLEELSSSFVRWNLWVEQYLQTRFLDY